MVHCVKQEQSRTPPVAVAMKEGIGGQFVINVVLTLIGWLPGVIHAFWVNTRGGSTVA
jgi:uncharacterized membrane protein YqaE (UPF0057 family)